MKEKKDYIVFSQHLCGWLQMQGYVLKNIKRTNKDDKYRNVFIFNETKSLLKSIEHYKQLQTSKQV